MDVPHSPVVQSDAGHHLNLRAPDNFPIELFVLTDAGAIQLGLTSDGAPVADTHRLET